MPCVLLVPPESCPCVPHAPRGRERVGTAADRAPLTRPRTDAAEPCLGCALSLDAGCLHILTDLRLLSVRANGLQLLWLVSMRDVQGVQFIDDTNSLLLTLAAAAAAGDGTDAPSPLDLNVRAVMCADGASARALHELIIDCISHL